MPCRDARDDKSPISVQQAKGLFADWKRATGLVLAVSGGPDSIALMWLAARWRAALSRGPDLLAVTVDHGLRPESAREAREVKRLARTLDVPHRTMRWSGEKPKSGVPAAARAARYRLLATVARQSGASHILTAHTRDDQAETLLMRLLRGSGISGLAAMARESEREGVLLARPFLNISKSQLIATLEKAKIGYADDPTNRDVSFTRPRIRNLIEGLVPKAAMRAIWQGWRRDWRAPMRRSRFWLTVLRAIWRSGIARPDRRRGARRQVARIPASTPRPFAALPEEIRLRLVAACDQPDRP